MSGAGRRGFEATRHPEGWSEARTELLKKLWGEGHSASQIAAKIGGVSREAICGKASRLGLGRTPASRPAPVSRSARKSALHVAGRGSLFDVAQARPPRACVPVSQEAPGQCTLLSLGPNSCRWPIGDPAADSFTFCGAQRERGPYCASHHKRSVSSVQPSAKTRPYVARTA